MCGKEGTVLGSTFTVAGRMFPRGIGCRFMIDPFADGTVGGGGPETGGTAAISIFTGL